MRIACPPPHPSSTILIPPTQPLHQLTNPPTPPTAGGYAAEHPRAFFQGMLDPPEEARLEAALRTLLEVQAVVVSFDFLRLWGVCLGGGDGGVWRIHHLRENHARHARHDTTQEDDDATPAPTRPRRQQPPQLRVTPLGQHLAALPCPVRLGKMLVVGSVLGVQGPALRCDGQ